MIQLRHAASRFSYCIVIVATDTIDSVQGIAKESKTLWCSVLRSGLRGQCQFWPCSDSGCDAEPLFVLFFPNLSFSRASLPVPPTHERMRA